MSKKDCFQRIGLICFLVLFLSVANSYGQSRIGSGSADDDVICAVYVTGIGCGNCAVTDPAIFKEWTAKNRKLIVFEYEIYSHRNENNDVKDDYFRIYASGKPSGVPFLLLNKDRVEIGRSNVLNMWDDLTKMKVNDFPSRYGFPIAFRDLNIAGMEGAMNIWTKNRVLISDPGHGGDSQLLRRLLTAQEVNAALRGVDYEEVPPEPVLISHFDISFENAVKIGPWRLQWNGEAAVKEPEPSPQPSPVSPDSSQGSLLGMLGILVFIGVSFLFLNRKRKIRKGQPAKTAWTARWKDILVAGVVVVGLILFFILAKNVSSDYLEKTGHQLPLPIFTFLIAIVDGFNPCNMFVLTCLMALLVATSSARLRLYAVGLSFVAMVYLFYFTFMAAWLNIFKYIGFIRPLSIALGVIAILAGLINCKELFFFRKGLTLTVSEKNKGPLMQKMDRMKDIIRNGSFPLLISSSIGLAALASLVELPCTAGFPIIYTGVLTGRGLGDTWIYYAYLMLYNLFYVIPLLVIISVFIYTLRARQLTQRQIEIMKFIGGVIMLLLGIILLVNPGLIGIQIHT